MKKAMVIGALATFVGVMLIPMIFKDGTQWSFNGTDLSDLQYTDVSFEVDGLTLAGMLFLPEGEGPFPVVVFIHGSGTSERNNPWYLTVVEHLQQNDIAVLLPDKRGSEKSEGDWTKSTFRDFAGDTSAAIDFIRGQTIFEYSDIGVIGHSQGGWVVPIVAAEDKDISFAISTSGPGVTVDEQVLYGEENDIADAGTYRFIAKLIAPLTAKSIMKRDCCRMIAGFDPVPYWRQVNIPSFMVFGAGDENVPVEESVNRIQVLNNENIILKVYPDGGHGITEVVAPGLLQIQAEFLRDLVDFIKDKSTGEGG